jgi:hypothetical protein
MIRTDWQQTDIPGVYVNGGVAFDFPSADLRLVVLVFAVVALVTWAVLMATGRP